MALSVQDSRILLKRSTTAAQAPTAAPSNDFTDGTWSSTDIYAGEAFANLVDEKFYLRFNNNIRQIAVASGPVTNRLTYWNASGHLDNIAAPIDDKVLKYTNASGYHWAEGGGAAVWGLITGNLADQTDLTSYVDSNLYKKGGNNFGANVELGTNDSYSLSFRTSGTARITINSNGQTGFQSSPSATAVVTIKAGTSSVASLRLLSGSLLTTPVNGSIENDGTNLYYTDDTPTRLTLLTTTAAAASYQPLDATLTALAGLATGANKIPYSTGTDVFSQLDLSTDANLGSSDTTLSSQKAIKSYVDVNIVAAQVPARLFNYYNFI
jgi:hypothetical protein